MDFVKKWLCIVIVFVIAVHIQFVQTVNGQSDEKLTLSATTSLNSSKSSASDETIPGCVYESICNDKEHYVVISSAYNSTPGCYQNSIIKWSLTLNHPNSAEFVGFFRIEEDYTVLSAACSASGEIVRTEGTDYTLRNLSASLQFVSTKPSNSDNQSRIYGDVFFITGSSAQVTDDQNLTWSDAVDLCMSIVGFAGAAQDPSKLGLVSAVIRSVKNFAQLFGKSTLEIEYGETPLYHSDDNNDQYIDTGSQVVSSELTGGRMGKVGQEWVISGSRVQFNKAKGKDIIYSVIFDVDLLRPLIKDRTVDRRELATTCDYVATVCGGANDHITVIEPS